MLYNNYAVFGRSKTGKTTFINKNFCDKFDNNHKFAVDFKQQLNVKYRIHSVEKLFLDVAPKVKNSLIVVDDATGILNAGNSLVSDKILFLLNTARHDNNYYIFVYHSVDYYPLRFTAGIHGFIFFNMIEKPNNIDKRLQIFEKNELLKICNPKRIGEFTAIYKNS